MKTIRSLIRPPWRLPTSIALVALLAASVAASAADDPVGVTPKLEGCRNDGSITLPIDGKFICPTSAYTTGNLGKGWNELDLVPYRITMSAGNSAPTSQTYAIAVAADNCDGAEGTIYTCADMSTRHPGFDVISAPVLNTALSSASCTAPVSVSSTGVLAPGVGGTAVTIYRTVTIAQLKNTTCVYDYYERLALGSHLYSGSSLHSDLMNQRLESAGGVKDVPLPVNEIQPQSLRKDMTANADQNVAWDITKTGAPANVSFGDVCATDAPTSKAASITITWTKSAATATGVHVTTHVYAKNPSSRTISVDVTDVIYKGTTQSTMLDTRVTGPVNVPANSEVLMLTHGIDLPATAGNVGDYLNDVATATYTDFVTSVPVPGETTAQAQAQIGAGSTSNNTASVADSESISGAGLSYSVPTPSFGSFLDGYIAGTPTTGTVGWESGLLSQSGTITFEKTIYLADQMITSGKLSDSADLVTSDEIAPGSDPVSVEIGISSSATVKLTVSKTIPSGYLPVAGDHLILTFHVAGAGGYANDLTFTFVNGGALTLSQELTGLTPDSFTVTETLAEFCDVADNCTTNTLLQPIANPLVVDLLPQNGSMTGRCAGTAAFTNALLAQGVRAQVQKLTDPVLAETDPDYAWTFTLSGPNVSTCVPAIAGAGAGFVMFQDSLGGDCLLSQGDYQVIETLKSGWRRDSAVPNDGIDLVVCKFSVDMPFDDGKTFSCSFHNTEYGHARVLKTVSGGAIGETQSFTFQLRQGATPTSNGTTLEELIANFANGGTIAFTTQLTPASHYQLCEIVMPGWLTSMSTAFVPNSFIPPDGVAPNPNVDNSIVCVDFTVAAGQTRDFAIDNTPPPGGRALTIGFWKNWASCKASNGHQEPVLDETLVAASPPGIRMGSYFIVAGQCTYAVNLLNKSTMHFGVKMASDPLFAMTAQMIAAELNLAAGAQTCPKLTAALTQANALLVQYAFNGETYSPKLGKDDMNLARNLATEFDLYNNNKTSACF